CQQHNNYSPTF
nr:immunoglobulin light chain junction region [Macaca mulatta]MOV77818.1 immunoglobulin light chain junction region [Macaca mulatta]MOV78072.1 immunoglobulin light chain junction region [Macaca mulatta]MOV78105.1 immunoglobulin light chain junction region [Macaca mulatta]MOV78137.1 immunoglobulin light chain junction region [Macaca mulatta]